MNTTRKIAYTGMFIALYVVLSMSAKIPVVAHISLDLGYIAFAIALYHMGIISGTIVGAAGCAIISMLTTGWFPPGWFAGNIAIGLICGFGISRRETTGATFRNIIVCVIAVAIGILGLKTIIECALYGIPFAVKLPKNAIAFAMDTLVMMFGMALAARPQIARLFKFDKRRLK